ncbi:MAG TPA: hypothetical protein VLC48_09210 [Gemmatimonadota bacterium]|nr:hypothetical protein [Gemmatimonadota bacterium]
MSGPPRFSGEVDLVIGQVEGPDELVFGRITGLAQGADGRIYVAAFQANEIRVYDESGAFLYRFGRKGGGPGELDGPCCLALAPDGRLWVRDNGNARYNGYSVAGGEWKFESSVRIQHSAANMWAPLTFDSEGMLIDVGVRPDPESGRPNIVRIHVTPAGATERVDVVPNPPPDRLSIYEVPKDGANYYLHQPHGARHLVAHSPGGGWADAVSSSYQIVWHLADGRETIIEQVGAVGPELSPDEREAGERQIAEYQRRLGLGRTQIPFDVPDRKPPIRDLFFDQGGRLWVELSVSEGSEHQADVYGPDGTLVARYRWPATVTLVFPGWIEDDIALGVARDDLGVERVVRLRFQPEGTG